MSADSKSSSSSGTSSSSSSRDSNSETNVSSDVELKNVELNKEELNKEELNEQNNIVDVKVDEIKDDEVIKTPHGTNVYVKKTTVIVEDPMFHRKRRAVKKVLLHPIFGAVVLAAAIIGIVCGVVLGKEVYEEPDIPSNDIVS